MIVKAGNWHYYPTTEVEDGLYMYGYKWNSLYIRPPVLLFGINTDLSKSNLC